MAKRGAKGKLTPERQATICGIIRQGLTQKHAWTSAGIDKSTFHRWIERGQRAARGKYRDFCDALTRAEMEGEIFLAAKWRKIVTEGTETRRAVYKDVVVKDGPDKEKVVRILDKETVETTGDGDWRGIAEYLRRRYPERWQRPEENARLDVELDGAGRIQLYVPGSERMGDGD